MKKLYIYICASVFTLSMVGCQDWMNVDPAGVQTTTTYWKTKGEVEGVLSAAYNALRATVTDGTLINWGEVRASDLGINGQSNLTNIRTGNILPAGTFLLLSGAHLQRRSLYYGTLRYRRYRISRYPSARRLHFGE